MYTIYRVYNYISYIRITYNYIYIYIYCILTKVCDVVNPLLDPGDPESKLRRSIHGLRDREPEILQLDGHGESNRGCALCVHRVKDLKCVDMPYVSYIYYA